MVDEHDRWSQVREIAARANFGRELSVNETRLAGTICVFLRLLRSAVLAVATAACEGSGATPAHVSRGDAGPVSTQDGGLVDGPRCTATPTKLIDAKELLVLDAGGISVAMDLALSATDLYVAVNYDHDGALLRIPVHGGKPVYVAPIYGSEQALLVTGDSVVLAESHDDPDAGLSGEIVRLALHGFPRTVLASGRIVLSSIFGPSGILATDGHNVLFAAQDGTKSVPLAGGAVQTLTTHTGSLAVVGSNVVIADSSAGAVFSVPITGGPVTTLATNLAGDLGPVLSCGSDICWASAVPVAPSESGTGSITQLSPAGALATLSEGGRLYVVYRLVFDGSDFFATMLADVSSGSLATIAGAGGMPVSLGSGSGLAIDDKCLYAGDVLQGVYSVAKTYRGDPLP
jgi:hypothetical protein